MLQYTPLCAHTRPLGSCDRLWIYQIYPNIPIHRSISGYTCGRVDRTSALLQTTHKRAFTHHNTPQHTILQHNSTLYYSALLYTTRLSLVYARPSTLYNCSHPYCYFNHKSLGQPLELLLHPTPAKHRQTPPITHPIHHQSSTTACAAPLFLLQLTILAIPTIQPSL